MALKIKLLSDFHDFYDFAFDQEGVSWERFANPGLSRVKMFQHLAACGFSVPAYGYCKYLIPNLVKHLGTVKFKVVVHLKEHSFGGDSKVLLDSDDALRMYPGNIGVQYIESHSTTYTYFKVGKLEYGLKYISTSDWRANCGEFKVDLVCEGLGNSFHKRIKYPIFSIDCVSNSGHVYAIDLNIAPKLRGTGLEYHLRPLQVYKQVRDFVNSL